MGIKRRLWCDDIRYIDTYAHASRGVHFLIVPTPISISSADRPARAFLFLAISFSAWLVFCMRMQVLLLCSIAFFSLCSLFFCVF